MIICTTLTACLLAPGFSGASAGRPPVSLVASPAHVDLAGRARQTIRVTNTGSTAVVLDIGRAGFGLDLRGRPRIVGSSPVRAWIAVRPRRLAVGPGESGTLTVASTPPPRAEPGDHGALVLMTTRPRADLGLAVRMRIGVIVVVRVPGAIVRRLEVVRLRVRRAGRARVLEVLIANRGNVTESLGRACVTISLRHGRRVLARVRPGARRLLPHTRGLFEARYTGAIRGRVTARVDVACSRAASRAFSLRL